jgi:hypothetical protein
LVLSMSERAGEFGTGLFYLCSLNSDRFSV